MVAVRDEDAAVTLREAGARDALWTVLQTRPSSCTADEVRRVEAARDVLMVYGLWSFSPEVIREIHQNVYRFGAASECGRPSSTCQACSSVSEQKLVRLPVCGHMEHPSCVRERMVENSEGAGAHECPVGTCPNQLDNAEMLTIGIEINDPE